MSIKVDITYDPGDMSVGIRDSVDVNITVGDPKGTHTLISTYADNKPVAEWPIEQIDVLNGDVTFLARDFTGNAAPDHLGDMPDVCKAVIAVWTHWQTEERVNEHGLTIAGIQTAIDEIKFNATEEYEGPVGVTLTRPRLYTESEEKRLMELFQQLEDANREADRDLAARARIAEAAAPYMD